MRRTIALVLALAGCGGGGGAPAAHESPAHVEGAEPESELPIVRFTPEAERRLAIETATVAESRERAVRLVGGEVIVPPGRTLAVTAPVGGMIRGTEGVSVAPGSVVHRGDALLRLVPIAPVDRDVRARADRDVASATAQLEAAEARVGRMQQLIAERAGSQRLLEEATAARDTARADLEQAQARARTTRETPLLADVAMTVRAPEDGIVRALSAAPGQAVAAGAPILEIVAVGALEVRVPVYSGDLARVDATLAARVLPAGRSPEGADGREAIAATPTAGPPTSDALASTVDRYYALPPDAPLAPGERVLVELPLHAEIDARVVPVASVVYDAQGAAWVYACAGEHAYGRARVDPLRRAGDSMVLARGPAVGSCVASVGAAEIFGSEFEPGH